MRLAIPRVLVTQTAVRPISPRDSPAPLQRESVCPHRLAAMGREKPPQSSSQAKMEKYTIPSTQQNRAPAETQGDSLPEGTVAEILSAIQVSALEQQIGGVQSDVSLIRQDLRNVVDRVTEAEGRISELENAVKELRSTTNRLSASNKLLENCAEDAKNHS